MTVIRLPQFSTQAAKLWNAIPADTRRLLLANVYCGKCCGAVSITNAVGAVKGGDLILTGNCAVCGGDVARHIERA